MKKLSFLSVIVVCMFAFSIASNATGVRSDFKYYEIENVDNLYLGKKVDKVWTLSYGNEEKPVTVVKRNTLEGTKYIVFSKYFEVCYENTSKGFGVNKVGNSWSSVPKRINRAVINNTEMQHQQIITPKQVDDERALGLIASYLPNLLNEDYTHLLK